MILGLNTDVRHAGKTFHIQTEDSGPGNPVLVTHLFIGGTIIATKKQSYADLVPEDGRMDEGAVRDRMREQHRGMFSELNAGLHDEAARTPTAPKARFKDIPLARKRREPSVSQPAAPAVSSESDGNPAPRPGLPSAPAAPSGPGPATLPPPLTLTDPALGGFDAFGALDAADGRAGAPVPASVAPAAPTARGLTEVPLAVPPPLGVTAESSTAGGPVRTRTASLFGGGLLGPPAPLPPPTSQAPAQQAPTTGPRATPRAFPPVLGSDELSAEAGAEVRPRPGPVAPPSASPTALAPPAFAAFPQAPPPLPGGVFDEGSVLDLSDEVDEVSVIDDGGLGEPPVRSAPAPLRFPTPMSMGRPLDTLLMAFLLDERD